MEEILGVVALVVGKLRRVFVIRYKNIYLLAQDLSEDFSNDWIYLNVSKWSVDPKNTEVFIINEDWLIDLQVDMPELVVNNSKSEVIPIECGDVEIETFIEVQTLEGVVINIKKSKKDFDFDLLVKAINYYREYDDFLEQESI